MSRYGTCSLCGEEIFEADFRDSYKQQISWVRIARRKADSAKAKQDTGAVAHGKCVDDRNSKMKRGIPVQQQGLF